jgi:hypothetical protein
MGLAQFQEMVVLVLHHLYQAHPLLGLVVEVEVVVIALLEELAVQVVEVMEAHSKQMVHLELQTRVVVVVEWALLILLQVFQMVLAAPALSSLKSPIPTAHSFRLALPTPHRLRCLGSMSTQSRQHLQHLRLLLSFLILMPTSL